MIMKTKWILIILKSLIQIVLDSMKEMENSGDVDADGVPLCDEYGKQGFVLASLRDVVKEIEENEK